MVLWIAAALAFAPIPPAQGQTETISVGLKLQTGGAISGLVVDHNEDGLVVMHESTPYVFAWMELEPSSAYVARRDLLALSRGGRDRLTAEDHYRLGTFALHSGRRDLARKELDRAVKLDPAYLDIVRETLASFDTNNGASQSEANALEAEHQTTKEQEREAHGLDQRIDVELAAETASGSVAQPSPAARAKVMEIYRSFGRNVQERIYKKLTLIETEHFLIWTDWEHTERDKLAAWCEAMYRTLCDQFNLDPRENVFLAKCPVFCWRSPSRFREFAQRFDGYTGKNAVGYTRSLERSGHIHIVLLRKGRSRADFDRFACTLVHEGTHAFLHRLHTTRLIPHWVNEGYADLIAERVLKDHCPNAEKASLLARQYVRYDWPIRHLLGDPAPIDVHEYPLAYSLVAYLEGLSPARFGGLIRSLKEGQTVGAALATAYDDMTFTELEEGWRAAIRTSECSGFP
jgi:hypothetical protein